MKKKRTSKSRRFLKKYSKEQYQFRAFMSVMPLRRPVEVFNWEGTRRIVVAKRFGYRSRLRSSRIKGSWYRCSFITPFQVFTLNEENEYIIKRVYTGYLFQQDVPYWRLPRNYKI